MNCISHFAFSRLSFYFKMGEHAAVIIVHILASPAVFHCLQALPISFTSNTSKFHGHFSLSLFLFRDITMPFWAPMPPEGAQKSSLFVPGDINLLELAVSDYFVDAARAYASRVKAGKLRFHFYHYFLIFSLLSPFDAHSLYHFRQARASSSFTRESYFSQCA